MHAQDVPEIKEHPANQYLLGEKQDYETPYYIFKGKNEYPKIIIDACIHGDEVAGAYACDTVMKYFEILDGTVIFIPRVNILAYNKGVRGYNVDLNQVFPGNKEGSLYEDKLAFDFMALVGELKPDIVINLHEAWTRYNQALYEKQHDKSFGQTLITNRDTFPNFLIYSLISINDKIENKENIFRIQYFPYKPHHSMDNIIEKFKIPSYTVETLRILPIEERINYQIYSILTFMEETGVKYKYKKL